MDLKSLGLAPVKTATVERRPAAEAGSAAPNSAATATATAATATARPAVSVQMSDLAASGLAAVAASGASASDQALLDELRHRIQSGTFEVDYRSLAQALVDNVALAAGRARPNPADR